MYRKLVSEAWNSLGESREKLTRIDVLKYGTQEKPVYRLFRDVTEHKSIIAKRISHKRAMAEQVVYKEILPKLSIPVPNYFGYVQEPKGQFGWFFLEDVGDEKYRSHIHEHRIAGAQWLGVMHMKTASLASGYNLPKRDSDHYLDLLHAANTTFENYLMNSALNKEERFLFEAIIAHCKELRINWRRYADTNQGVPSTLIHGDFNENNVRIQTKENRIIVLPFDWEKAGWGVPAEDISNIDIQTYGNVVKEYRPNLLIQNLVRLAKVGKVYRCLVYLDWIATELMHNSPHFFMEDLRKCDVWLTNLIQAL